MNTAEPSVAVLGLYSAKADPQRFQEAVQAFMDSQDPARLGAEDPGEESLTAEECLELEEQFSDLLGNAVYVEVLVRHPGSRFDVGKFLQPDPKLRDGMAQVAWNEIYLSEDGETVVAGPPFPKVPAGPVLRLVFVIHYWNSALPLMSPYGPAACPAVQPLPERLWRLAPYEMPS